MRNTHTRDTIVGSLAICAAAAAIVCATIYFQGTSSKYTYQLVGHYVPSGEKVILDEELTFLDCLEDAQDRSKRWGTNVRFTCDREDI